MQTKRISDLFFRFAQDPYGSFCGRLWPLFFLFYRSKFMHLGKGARIAHPTRIMGSQYIWIGDNTEIDQYCEIHADPVEPNSLQPVIRIGNGCSIQPFNRIGARKYVEIQDNVLLASNIYISDSTHPFENVTMPIIFQPFKTVGSVILETGCWIGDGVKILGNVRIGKNSVIGANSVVNSDIPAYSVAVGAPARVIKQWEPTEQRWVKVK